jgi:hypothetical protein
MRLLFAIALLDVKKLVHRLTIKVHETISKSPLKKSTVLMSISNNNSEVTNETHDEVNIRSIDSEVASPQRYVRSLINSVLRQMRCGLKLRDSGHLMPGLENKT